MIKFYRGKMVKTYIPKKRIISTADIYEEIFRTNETNPEITSSSTWNIRFTEREKERYSPFNSLYLRNEDSNNDIEIRIDGDSDNVFKVPAGATFIINPEEGINFNFLDIVNNGTGTISASQINVRIAKAIVSAKIVKAS